MCRVNFRHSYGELHLTQIEHDLSTISKLSTILKTDLIIWKQIVWESSKNGIQILVGPAFLELLIETCKILFIYHLSITLYKSFLFEKGVSEGDVPGPQKLWKLIFIIIFKPNLRDLMHTLQ